eukprot:gnl/TRDRNA2_/TRDRNA2_168501_c1_seq1.p1 gnl/TRDRNA2_/TRDRNA2_168501_c1~~gnl/TRDRNA2_/TRDRNA2_168501_c1_seq1.p1  ORF type:complete len:409 (+),score=46.69 gnl/TRDRNA2_/TRDRNA2_168501_c1_seq1:78-1304(+)
MPCSGRRSGTHALTLSFILVGFLLPSPAPLLIPGTRRSGWIAKYLAAEEVRTRGHHVDRLALHLSCEACRRSRRSMALPVPLNASEGAGVGEQPMLLRQGTALRAAAAASVPLLRCVKLVSPLWCLRCVRQLVASGHVRIDGRCSVDEQELVSNDCRVTVLCRDEDGREHEMVAPGRHEFYLKLAKPRGVVCSAREVSSSRPTFSALFPCVAEGLHSVGRLDRKSEGLILVTTDGAFTNFVNLPETHVQKEYLALTCCGGTRQPPSESVLAQLVKGVELSDGLARADEAEVVDFDGLFARLRIVVTSGRFHMVRRMLQAVGYHCSQLIRTRIGNISGIVVAPFAGNLTEVASIVRNEQKLVSVAPAALGNSSALLPGEFAALEPHEVADVYRRGLHWLDEHRPLGPFV